MEVEDIRLLIGQQIGLPYLIPMAIELLAQDILTEGDLFEGDLLTNVVSASHDYWNQNKDQRKTIINLYESNIEKIENELSGSILKQLQESYKQLKSED